MFDTYIDTYSTCTWRPRWDDLISLPHADSRKGPKCRVLSVVTLTFDLDIQTRPSEEPSSLPCKFLANPFRGSRDI